MQSESGLDLADCLTFLESSFVWENYLCNIQMCGSLYVSALDGTTGFFGLFSCFFFFKYARPFYQFVAAAGSRILGQFFVKFIFSMFEIHIDKRSLALLNTDLTVFFLGGGTLLTFFPHALLRFSALPVLPLRLFFRPSLLLDAMTSSMFRRRASLARQRPPSHQLMVKRATMSGSRRYLGKPPKRCLETSNQLHPRGPSTISIRKARTSVVSFSDFVSQSLLSVPLRRFL